MAIMDFGMYSQLVDATFREILDKELADQRSMIERLCTMRRSDRASEKQGSVGELPQWNLFGGQLDYPRFHEQYASEAFHRQFAQGMVITRYMYESDLSGVLEGDKFRKMVRSKNVTQNTHAARVFNMATSVDALFWTWTEGVPLVSTAHTTRTPGVSTAQGFSNLIVGSLTPTNYRAGLIQMKLYRNDVGDLCDIDGNELWVPTAMAPVATEILKTPYGLDTPFRNVNPEYQSAEVVEWNRIQDTDASYLCNREMRKESVLWWDWIPVEYESIKDFETKQMKWSGYGAWSYQVRPEWRWLLAFVPS